MLCGHVHQAPFTDDGAWAERCDGTWLFNSGAELGPVPAHVVVDLDGRSATWWSSAGPATLPLDAPPSRF